MYNVTDVFGQRYPDIARIIAPPRIVPHGTGCTTREIVPLVIVNTVAVHCEKAQNSFTR